MSEWPIVERVISAPGTVAKSVTAYLAGDVPASTPRDSATIVLVRPGAVSTEVYLQQRASTMAVSAGRYVFPGGLVDRRDLEDDVPWHGPSIDEWTSRLGGSIDVTRGVLVAAVRETFEESGVLLASAPGSEPPPCEPSWETARQALTARALTFGEFLRERDFVLRSDLLHEVTRWITPPWAGKRFDTRFFVATVPEGQQPSANSESDLDLWMDLGEVIHKGTTRELDLMYPTLATLKGLATAADVEQLLSMSRDPGAYEFHLVAQDDASHAVFTKGPGGITYAYSIRAAADATEEKEPQQR